ncbi:hypothetical protein [Spartinivicinus ruber]|uniref:hypothetical protein n=1 Tax=Spartinivicinus ruber TaxID=2683272 RepID=UPI0013D0106C|nr:hypothetical protein [Spartinivicinus ruber]
MSSIPSYLTNKRKADPQSVFIKLSSLEMQKKISRQERTKALKRIEKLDSRLKEIDEAIASLLASLDLGLLPEDYPVTNHSSPSLSPATKDSAIKSKPIGGRRFIMRY